MQTLQVAPDLADIALKVESGRRLTYDDGVRLYASRDLFEIGRLANLVRERLHGNNAYYNVNRHINYSNYCVLRCNFCSFYRPYDINALKQPRSIALPLASTEPTTQVVGDDGANSQFAISNSPFAKGATGSSSASANVESALALAPFTAGAYELSIPDIVARAKDAYDHGATEVHIVGGLHPKLPFDFYLDLCRAIRDACPRMHIKAFTAIEIIHFTRISKPRLSIRQVLEQLRDAGLGSLPGGGAEIFDDRVHAEAYRNKVGEAGWFDVHRTAHEIGMYTNATMLYGHIEQPHERIAHMVKLREHQEESLRSRKAAFNCFIPLSFIPDGSELAHLPGPTGVDDLKTLAISRLMLDNIPHIKAFWIMQSAKLAQVSLDWGIDDLDGTVVYYDITKREGGAGNTHQEMTIDRMQRLIAETGRTPVERDTLYRRVERDGVNWRVCD